MTPIPTLVLLLLLASALPAAAASEAEGSGPVAPGLAASIVLLLSGLLLLPKLASGAVGRGCSNQGRGRRTLRGVSTCVVLHARISPDRIFESEPRSRVDRLVRASPGITFGELRSSLRLTHGALAHHLRILMRHGFLVASRAGRCTRYYISSTPVSGLTPIQERLMREVKSHPGMTTSDLARILGVSRQTVSYNLRRMGLSRSRSVKDRAALIE
jgi:DNA-binding MarR family transcriptional regulator